MAQKKLKTGGTGAEQAATVMREFHKGKLRRLGGKLVQDIEQAKAIAMQEGRAAEKRGTETRTYKGRTRERPKLTPRGKKMVSPTK